MKNILGLIMGVFMLVGCKAEPQVINGFEYKMLNTPENVTATISFAKEGGKFFGKVANRFFGTYELDGNNIKFGPAGSTMMMGPEEAMKVESEVLKSFPLIKSFKVKGDKLIFTKEDGSKLEFVKTGEI